MVQWCSCALSRRPRQHSHVSSPRKSNKTNVEHFLPRSTRAASSPPAGNESRRRCVFSLTFASRTRIDFFFSFSFSSHCSRNTLLQRLRGVVSEVTAQRVTHLLATRRGNSSTNLVFLGFLCLCIVAGRKEATAFKEVLGEKMKHARCTLMLKEDQTRR